MLGHPHAVAAAVLAGTPQQDGPEFQLAMGVLHGTAFALAPGIFATAHHVLEEASAVGRVALGRLDGPRTQIQLVRGSTVFRDDDLALLACPLDVDILPCLFEPLFYLADVASYGYPAGLELEPAVHIMRAFKGTVVTRRALTHLPGWPPGYELSFLPGPGLSGAPLLHRDSKGVVSVSGMVLGSRRTTIGDKFLDVGMALDIHAMLSLASDLVGGTLAERVFSRPPKLRVRRP